MLLKSTKEWLDKKRAELPEHQDVPIFIEARDVLDAIEQLSKPRLFKDSRLVKSLIFQYAECEERKKLMRHVLATEYQYVGKKDDDRSPDIEPNENLLIRK